MKGEMCVLQNLEIAADKWKRALDFVLSNKFVLPIDRRDLTRRLMELDEAIGIAERYECPSNELNSLLLRVHQMMMGNQNG